MGVVSPLIITVFENQSLSHRIAELKDDNYALEWQTKKMVRDFRDEKIKASRSSFESLLLLCKDPQSYEVARSISSLDARSVEFQKFDLDDEGLVLFRYYENPDFYSGSKDDVTHPRSVWVIYDTSKDSIRDVLRCSRFAQMFPSWEIYVEHNNGVEVVYKIRDAKFHKTEIHDSSRR